MLSGTINTLVGALKLPTYDRRAGQYRREDGRFVPRSTILRLVDEEAARLSVQMQSHIRSMMKRSINLPEFERRAADDLKLSHLRMAIFASGGRNQTTNKVYGAVGQLLARQYKYLAGFADDLSQGKLTYQQALARASMYGTSTRLAFHQAEKITKVHEGFTQAKRVLDPESDHCPDCLTYATDDYVPIGDIVPIGLRCQCRQRCRCRIIYQR